MKNPALDPRAWLALLSLALVLWLTLVDADDPSPGPLSPPHSALAGGGRCEECHGTQDRTLAESCLACHLPVDVQLARGEGLHGGLEVALAQDCGHCHLEHHGDEVPLVGPGTFDRAGVPERDAFDHAGLAFDLEGVHRELACDACHEHADAPFLVADQVRFLGLESACTTCHENPHGEEQAARCDACHGQSEPFAQAPGFEHTAAFPLEGAHAGRACTDCHEPDGASAWFETDGPDRGRPVRGCADCHDSPHSAALAAFEPDCAACHASGPGGFERATEAPVAALHAALAFPLEAAHGQQDCAACHDPALAPSARYPGERTGDCRSCHEDPHAGQFLEPDGTPRGCTECHGLEAFAPSRFDLAAHARTDLPLEGAHAAADCTACHVAPRADAALAGAPVTFAGLDASCASCHGSAHVPPFLDAAGTERACSECHDPAAFAPVAEGRFDHGRDTGFALEGAHLAGECAACHRPTAASRDLGRTLGLVAEAFPGPAERCGTCHADVHDPSFEPEDCALCHTPSAFAELRPDGFDHGAHCGFELTGAHAAADCASCHAAPASPDAGRTLGLVAPAFPGDPARCDTCHTDPHGGAFRATGATGTDCARCHTTQTFAEVGEGFDHGRDAGFDLLGAHAAADCTACHATLPAPDALGRRHARAAGTTCTACHTDPHLGQFAEAGRTDCTRCHDPAAAGPLGPDAGAFGLAGFDHDRTRFPLDDTHRDVACASCHVPWPVADGREVVRYRPLGTRCGDCHRDGRDRR